MLTVNIAVRPENINSRLQKIRKILKHINVLTQISENLKSLQQPHKPDFSETFFKQ